MTIFMHGKIQIQGTKAPLQQDKGGPGGKAVVPNLVGGEAGYGFSDRYPVC